MEYHSLFYEWATKQNFSGRWMPECREKYELFYREYYWSPAYKYYDIEGLTKREIYDTSGSAAMKLLSFSAI